MGYGAQLAGTYLPDYTASHNIHRRESSVSKWGCRGPQVAEQWVLWNPGAADHQEAAISVQRSTCSWTGARTTNGV
jgi:hypothetical protein